MKIKMIKSPDRWVLCPICGNKTRTKIRPDTILENFPLFCPKCKQETLISAKDLNVAVIPQQIAESAGAVNGQDERRINVPPLTASPVFADGQSRRESPKMAFPPISIFTGVSPQVRDTLSRSPAWNEGRGLSYTPCLLMKPVLRLRLHATQSQPCFVYKLFGVKIRTYGKYNPN